MVAWLSWLFESPADAAAPASSPRDELRRLRARRRELINNACSLRAYGFDTAARDGEAALRVLDRKILALQLKAGVSGEDDAASRGPIPI